MKQRYWIQLTRVIISSFLVVGLSNNSIAQDGKKTFYRYTNEQGVKVVNQTIPPQYVRNGYELVSQTGEVLKVVPASPSEADAARVAQERKEAKEREKADLQLRRSYSAVGEIDAARARHLDDLQNNINILQANLQNVRVQLKTQEANAAAIERNGKAIPEDVLKNISTLKNAEKDLAAQIKQRGIEYQAASNKFDQDRKRFLELTAPNK